MQSSERGLESSAKGEGATASLEFDDATGPDGSFIARFRPVPTSSSQIL